MITHLTLEFHDCYGRLVERICLPVEVALVYAREFMEVHGTDPDYDGAQASRGTVTFTPMRADGVEQSEYGTLPEA